MPRFMLWKIMDRWQRNKLRQRTLGKQLRLETQSSRCYALHSRRWRNG